MSSDDKNNREQPPTEAQNLPDDPISRQLRHVYQSVANESLPDELQSLLERLKQAKPK